MAWVWLVLLYGVLKGARDIAKKKALEKSTVLSVLFFYTFLSFLLVLPGAGGAMGVSGAFLGYTAIKSFVIFVGWICGFYALEKMPVSLYGVLDLSQMLFTMLLGVVFLGERMTLLQGAGLMLVLGGLIMLRLGGKNGALKGEGVSAKLIGLALACCLLNGVSGTMDKVLMKHMTSTQLQFWYMFFLCSYYAAYMLLRKIRFDWKNVLKNYWIWVMAVLFVIGDRALFIANGMADSRVTVMTLVKQSSCVVAILGGRLVFREKNIGYKLICAAVVIAGIVIAVL
ncbi:MAG: DMT family transporter [Clostridia bacterium]|nr:DMT family transporter [Clostridia bacterium]